MNRTTKFQKRVRSRASAPAGVREEGGFQLVEMLVAIGIITIFMAGILDALSQTYRSSTATQNQLIASTILQGLIDDVRNSNWNTINGLVGTSLTSSSGQIVIVKTSSSQTGSAMHPRPVLCDLTTSGMAHSACNQNPQSGSITPAIFGGGYSREAEASLTAWLPTNANCGTITEQYVQQSAGIVRVNITIDWPGENGGGRRRLTGSTFVSQYGIHN